METTAHRAELADVAAPPGGWPSLARELIEVRFFMDRGELDEAFELLAVLRERYPGHPELIEFKRGPTDGGLRPDTQVNRVVDSVLSGSSSLSAAMPRRSAPQWNAPAAEGADRGEEGKTRAHEVVPAVHGGAGPASRKRVVRTAEPRRAGSFPTVSDAASGERPSVTDVNAVVPPAAESKRVRVKTDRHAGLLRKPGRGTVSETPEPEPEPVAEADPSAGLTVAVASLQPAAPFAKARARGQRSKNVVRKRMLKARKRSGAQRSVEEGEGGEGTQARRRKRGSRFGQHVLGRLGKDGKPGATS